MAKDFSRDSAIKLLQSDFQKEQSQNSKKVNKRKKFVIPNLIQYFKLDIKIMNNNEIHQLQKQLANKKTTLKTIQDKCQLQTKKIKLLRKENEDLKTTIDKQSQKDTELLLNSKQLSDANSKLQQAIEQLQKKMSQPSQMAGCSVTTIGTLTVDQQTQQIDLPNQSLTDEDILQLRSFPQIKTLILSQNKLTNSSISMICQKLPSLKKLFINNNQFTAQALKGIQNLKQLKQLDIRNCKLGDQVVQYVSLIASLQQLSISKNEITDKNLSCFVKLQSLLYLDLTNNSISDEGAKNLVKIKALTHLYLNCNKITSLGARWLIKDLSLTVLDLRFNAVEQQEKEKLKKLKSQMQIFL